MKYISLNWTLALKFSIGKKKRMRDCRILMAHYCIHPYNHSWFVRTLRTLKTERTLRTKRIKNALLIPEIKYKVSNIPNTHTSVTVKFSVPCIKV